MAGAPKQSKKTKAPKRAPLKASREKLTENTWQLISKKAFELWQERGHQDGHALDDWLDAEAIVMEEIHEARE